MSQDYGQGIPQRHVDAPHRATSRWLVMIDAGGVAVARLYLESRELVSEFDAGSEEVAVMTRGLVPAEGADGPEWDHALGAHADAERRAARVYRLDV